MRKSSSKYTNRYVFEYFKKFDYILLSKYKNVTTKLKLKCPSGHIIYQTFELFKRGHRCSICFYKKLGDMKREKIENIKKYVEKFGYLCLSKEFLRDKIIILKCPYGHIYNVRYDQFKSGYRCPVCARVKKYSFTEVKKYIEKVGYKCLSTNKEWNNTKSKIKFQCPNNHIYKTRFDIFQQGGRCPICKYIKHSIRFSGSKNPAWKGGISHELYCEEWSDKEYKESIKARDGYKCLNPECNGMNNQLCIHHIDYIKKNCHPSNLITLCFSCNGKANKDREWHKNWYKAILFRRYDID